MLASLRTSLIAAALLATWIVFAAWQYHEFGHERQNTKADLLRQSEVLRQALLGGASAHRRLGRVFEEQMQAVFDEITDTPGVIAVRLEAKGESVTMNAGQTDLLRPAATSPMWLPQGLQTSEEEEMRVLPPGQGQGNGSPGWMRGSSVGERPVSLRLTLLMDRTAADEAIRSASRLRVAVALAGGAVFLAVGLAWASAIRSVEARAQNQALQAEKGRLEELSQAASGLAHETRNPLGVIRGGLQKMLLNSGPPSANGDRSKIRLLVEECDRVTSRINQFLAYARPQTANMEVVTVEPLIEELGVLLQSDLEDAGVRLLPRIEDGCGTVVADAGLLRQVLFNLLQERHRLLAR